MKRLLLITWMLVGIIASASAQHDDLYFVPKKKNKTEKKEEVLSESSTAVVPTNQLEMDEDAYNRRSSYLTEQGDVLSEFAMSDAGFVLITEEGDTMWMDTDTLRLTRVQDDEGWINGFEGSDSDYEYAMRIVRFRNPRYAIPVSSPLYWDVVYGGAMWPSWEWNIYDDGTYAYVFPTSSNWHYWDYMMSYPFGWSPWGYSWAHHHGYPYWGNPWGSHYGWHFYGHVWYDPWFNPYYPHYPGWNHGHHHGHHPSWGVGKPVWNTPKAYPNHRTSAGASTRRDVQQGNAAERNAATTRVDNGTSTRRIDNGSSRNSSVRVVTGSTDAVRTTANGRTINSEVIHRSTGSSSANRSTTTTGSGYTRQSPSRSTGGSSSSYNRSSSNSSSSSMNRSTSTGGSRSTSYSTGSSTSSRSNSYSGGGSSRSSSYGGGSYSGSSSRSSGGSYSGSSSSRSSSGSRR